jgi:hypothetical protein
MSYLINTASMSIDEQGRVMGGTDIGCQSPINPSKIIKDIFKPTPTIPYPVLIIW